VPFAKMIPNVLGERAHFSTTQKLYSSSSDPKKRACFISTYIFIENTHIFLPKMWEARKVPPAEMVKLLLQVCINNRG